jgi:hypothetical protein
MFSRQRRLTLSIVAVTFMLPGFGVSNALNTPFILASLHRVALVMLQTCNPPTRKCASRGSVNAGYHVQHACSTACIPYTCYTCYTYAKLLELKLVAYTLLTYCIFALLQ